MSLTLFLASTLTGLLAIFYGLRSIRFGPGREFQVQDIGKELKETCTYVDDLKGCEGNCTFWLLELGFGLTVVVSFVVVQRLFSTNRADCCSFPVHLLPNVPSGSPIWTSTTPPQLAQVTLQHMTRAPKR